jgi:hypothetical protein
MDKLYKSNKSCFLIPLHPPDYIYLHNLELIVKKCNVQVYIVLSNRDEKIEKIYNNLSYIYFNEIYTGNVTNWPTQKKFYATKYIYDNTDYKYVIACDAEIKIDNFFSPDILTSICENFFINKKFYGGDNSDVSFQLINTDCMRFINIDEWFIEKYKSIYFWFTELPIYERNSYNLFFQSQNLYNRSFVFNNYDYLLYAYWMCINKNFKIINWNNLEINQKLVLNCSGELISSNKFISFLEKHNIYLHWLSYNYANKIKRKYIILKYHTDRNDFNSMISIIKYSLYKIFKKVCHF